MNRTCNFHTCSVLYFFHSFLSNRIATQARSHLEVWKRIPEPVCGYGLLLYKDLYQFEEIERYRTFSLLLQSAWSSMSPSKKLHNGRTTWLILHLHHPWKIYTPCFPLYFITLLESESALSFSTRNTQFTVIACGNIWAFTDKDYWHTIVKGWNEVEQITF